MFEEHGNLMLIGGLIGGVYGFWREARAGSSLGWKLFGIFAGGFICATLLVVGRLFAVLVMLSFNI